MWEAARRIGFNTSVRRDQRTFHVQTEISGKEAPTIRTTVHEGGLVVHVHRQPCPESPRGIDELEALAREQHEQCLGRLARAEIAQ